MHLEMIFVMKTVLTNQNKRLFFESDEFLNIDMLTKLMRKTGNLRSKDQINDVLQCIIYQN